MFSYLWYKLTDKIHSEYLMFLGTILVLGFMLFFGGCATSGTSKEFLSPYLSARDQVIALVAKNGGNGSGVIIAPETVLTARHVAKEIAIGNALDAIDRNGKDLGKATIVRVGTKDIDLAILHVDGLKCPAIVGCAKIATSLGKTDEPLVVIGFPLRKEVGLQYVTQGNVEGIQTVENSRYLMMSAHAAGGNSGGGVFVYRYDASLGRARWEVLGILVAGVSQPVGLFGVPTNYISAAMPNDEIKDFLLGKNSQDAKDYHPSDTTL